MQQQKSLSDEQQKKLQDLRDRVANEEPLSQENYFQDESTLLRFLRAREWSTDAAEKQLRSAIAWRRSYAPLSTDCKWCHDSPGFHSMRQVGFDESGRPIIYSCFAQAQAGKNSSEDSIAHCVYLIENAKRCMRPGVETWIFVIDCTGITLPMCNPSLSSGVVSVFGDYYPEHMEKIIVINHSTLFHGVWNAIKVFIDPKTLKKMKFIRGKEKMQRKFKELLGGEMASWLLEEVRQNKQEPLPDSQEKFWEGPIKPGQHDPRGAPSYVESFVDPYFLHVHQQQQQQQQQQHKPHPNIADQQLGQLANFLTRSQRKEQKKRHKLDPKEEAAELAAFGAAAAAAGDIPEIDSDSEEEKVK